MKFLTSLKPLFKLGSLLAITLTATSLTNCGGGSSSSTAGTTVRPRTLNTVNLRLSSSTTGPLLQFTRTAGSATNNGDTETGTFTYANGSSVIAFTQIGDNGANLTIRWPETITGPATYSYRAINNSSGELILNVGGANFTLTPGTSYLSPTVASSVRLFITWQSTGGNAATANVRMTSNQTPALAVPSNVTGSFFTAFNGAVLPLNFSDTVNSALVSNIAPATIGGRNIIFTNTTTPANSFTIQTVSTTTPTTTTASNDSGTATLSSGTIFGVASPNNTSYAYTRVNGTNNANLVFGSTLNPQGTIILTFTAAATGTYSINGATVGTFLIN